MLIDSFKKSKFQKNDITDCWIWLGYCDRDGYGEFSIAYNNKQHVRAHRFSYEYFLGTIPENLQVCHKCDNPKCVNPNHLFLGTSQDNKNDSVNKKRHAYGIHQGGAILNDNDVKQIIENILANKYSSVLDISKEWNIHQSTVNNIINETRWTHVTKQFDKKILEKCRQILAHKKGRKLTNDVIIKINELRSNGYTIDNISKILGISKWSVDKYKL